MNKKYDMNFEDSQDYIQKRGLDVPWNDCDVFIDERAITRTVGNVLLWADEHPIHYDGKAYLYVLHKGVEQGKKEIIDKIKSLIKEWELCTSAEAKYKVEAYKELMEIIEEEDKE